MKKIQILLFAVFIVSTSFKTGKPAWMLFSENGKKEKYSDLVKKIQQADILLFGKLHDNPVAHWIQLELARDLFKTTGQNLVIGAEMFETENQLILNEYLDSLISENYFEAETRLWPNYQTDYKPLVNFARENQLRFIATNIPRRYASIVYSKGFEGLEEISESAKKFLPPLPIPYNPELKAYSSMMEMQELHRPVDENFSKSQALKDAAMAWFMLKNWSPGKLMFHINGAFHSDNFESIYWYLKHHNPDLNVVTITTVEQENIKKLSDKNKGKADYINCVVEGMTKTH